MSTPAKVPESTPLPLTPSDPALTDMSPLYHANIIGTIPYGQRRHPGAVDQGGHECFLKWGDTTAHNSLAL